MSRFPISICNAFASIPAIAILEQKETGSTVQEFSVEVSASGNGTVTGGGSYVSGEFAKVTAIVDDNETFFGWYVDNTLVSSETEYRFLVNKDVNIIAKFTEASVTGMMSFCWRGLMLQTLRPRRKPRSARRSSGSA